jgi:riboflavin biosynthesis pyrimidine reductase
MGNNCAMSVVASLVVGIDGATTKDGRSSGVSSPADRAKFLARRRAVDVIIIGGNTARSEPYSKTVVPLVVISRSLVNPVQGNHLSHFWNCSPSEAVTRARKLFGENILIEGGASMINELIEHNLIDQLELSVTPIAGGDEKIDWKVLLGKFANYLEEKVDQTIFYSASN